MVAIAVSSNRLEDGPLWIFCYMPYEDSSSSNDCLRRLMVEARQKGALVLIKTPNGEARILM